MTAVSARPAALNIRRWREGRGLRRSSEAARPVAVAASAADGAPSRSRLANTKVKAIEMAPNTGSGPVNGAEKADTERAIRIDLGEGGRGPIRTALARGSGITVLAQHTM